MNRRADAGSGGGAVERPWGNFHSVMLSGTNSTHRLFYRRKGLGTRPLGQKLMPEDKGRGPFKAPRRLRARVSLMIGDGISTTRLHLGRQRICGRCGLRVRHRCGLEGQLIAAHLRRTAGDQMLPSQIRLPRRRWGNIPEQNNLAHSSWD